MESVAEWPKHIHISGRRWYRRGIGGTYHTAAIYIDGEHAHTTAMQYGYEDQYQQTAGDWLAAHGFLPTPLQYPLSRWLRDDLGIQFTCEVADVSREKDLHGGGK